ncbi:MAG TPA: hypothetical protein VN696_08665 [Pyrinomonadaceae bacterium]|nr:hypothetical protein [Pyrinomonadaceae bacterium]
MTAKKTLVILLCLGFVALVLAVIVSVAFRFTSIKRDRVSQKAREERLASVERYVNQATEQHTGEPPQFLYYVEYRILKKPYPSVSEVEAALGRADSRSETSSGTKLEWLGNPSSDPVLLGANFDKNQKLEKLDYHLKRETIGRWPSDWQKEIEIRTGSPTSP